MIYAGVKYQGIYPGIDLFYYGNQKRLEYDFVISPGADPKTIRLAFEGVKNLRVDRKGDLVLQTSLGEVRNHKPVIYQEVGTTRQVIAGRYLVKGKQEVGFEISAYDKSKPLIIDPVLTCSTYFGGSGMEQPASIAVDDFGNAYITGFTESINFPVTNSSQPSFGGGLPTFL